MSRTVGPSRVVAARRAGFRTRPAVSCAVILSLAAACGPASPQAASLPAAPSAEQSPSSASESLPGWFAFTVPGGDLWVMRGDGSGRRQVTESGDGVDTSPTWAPDARRLAFRHSVGTGGGPGNTDTIRIVQADGTGLRELVPGSFPAWSPDGDWIAFRGVSGVDLAVIKPDGSSLTPYGIENAECPVWAPDGRRILYCRNSDSGGGASDNWDVWVMNRDGSARRQLTQNPARDYPVAWSGDGSEIAFFSDRDGKGASFVMRADGSDQAPLTAATDLSAVGAWLPDGSFVIASGGGKAPEWYVLGRSEARKPIPQLSGAFDPIAWIGSQ